MSPRSASQHFQGRTGATPGAEGPARALHLWQPESKLLLKVSCWSLKVSCICDSESPEGNIWPLQSKFLTGGPAWNLRNNRFSFFCEIRWFASSQCVFSSFCYVGRQRKPAARKWTYVRLIFRTLLATINGKNCTPLRKKHYIFKVLPLNYVICIFEVCFLSFLLYERTEEAYSMVNSLR